MADPGAIMLSDSLVSLGPDGLVTPAATGGAQPGCCDCTVTATLYAMACPCGSVWAGQDLPSDCGVPASSTPGGACLLVDLRSILSDNPARLGMRLFGFWQSIGGQMVYTGPTIKVGEYCYRFVQPDVLYADASLTQAQREAALAALTPPGAAFATMLADVPAGSSLVGGDGVVIPVVGGCGTEYGCAPVPPTHQFYAMVPCDGNSNGTFRFICARLSYAGQTSGCWCVVRSRGYTSAEVASLDAANPGRVFVDYGEPAWDVVWTYGPLHPNRRPATSCCFCLGNTSLSGTSAVCLTGRQWSNVWGAHRWFYTELCCGKLATLTYRVDLRYTRVLTQVLQFGDTLTTTITARIDRVVPDGTGAIRAIGTLTTVAVRSNGQSDTSVSPLEIGLGAVCCLYPSFDHRLVPTIGGLTQDGTTFTDDYDGTPELWSQLTLPASDPSGLVPEGANQLRNAWRLTPWAQALQVVAVDQGGTYSGSGLCFGTCSSSNFRLTESTNDGFGRVETVNIDLSVVAVYDNSAPCGYVGSCGPHGWGTRDITELVP